VLVDAGTAAAPPTADDHEGTARGLCLREAFGEIQKEEFCPAESSKSDLGEW